MSKELYAERNGRIQDAVALKEPDQLPLAPFAAGLPFFIYGKGSYEDLYYNPDVCEEPLVRFHEEFQPDLQCGPTCTSGAANEIAETQFFDWPGRPGSIVDRMSTYQVHEREFMLADEYDELLHDFTGFIINKYIPRALPGLKGLEGFRVNPVSGMGAGALGGLLSPPVTEVLAKIIKIAEVSKKTDEFQARLGQILTEKGFPAMFGGMGLVPFDVISDMYRGTAGMFDDQIEQPEKVREACDFFAEKQIAGFQYLRYDLPVKRIFFPLHKGMDGFISHEQYHELYWEPFQKMLAALIDMGATPVIYTEGPYNSRISYMAERLSELKKGTCIVHFEKGDFAGIKKTFQGIACISGGMPIYTLEWEGREKVADRMKYLIDTCAPGGGYIFDTDCGVENAKYENIQTMFDTARSYGKK